MNIEKAKKFAEDCLNKENIDNFKIVYFELHDEDTNDRMDVYLGDIESVEDGKECSSLFKIVVYKNGKMDFEWS